jgi:hypothetical protein
MSERIINSAWRLVVMAVIFILTCAAMFQFYQGMLNLFGGTWQFGIAPVITGAIMAAAVYWLASHREDLVDV